MRRAASERPCLLCGSRHRACIHAWCDRLVRCPDGRNHRLSIVTVICAEARRQGKQYTKRILPWFVIPECNIRLDLVLNLLKLQERGGPALAYEQADTVIGSASEPTIRRHLRWVQRLVAATVLEAAQLVAQAAAFAALPAVRATGGGRSDLRRYVAALTAGARAAGGRAGAALSVVGCVHRRYVAQRARSPVRIPPLNQVLPRGCWFDTS